MIVKIKKKKKSKTMRATTTHGHGARKRWKGKGRKGGKGMAGTGKRADHKKSKVIKLYGNKYFGKQGITSKGTKRKKIKAINLREIKERFKDQAEINLKDYKILGDGEISKPITITAKAFTKSAKDKIEKAGGKIIAPIKKTMPLKKQEIKKEKSPIDTNKKQEEISK